MHKTGGGGGGGGVCVCVCVGGGGGDEYLRMVCSFFFPHWMLYAPF